MKNNFFFLFKRLPDILLLDMFNNYFWPHETAKSMQTNNLTLTKITSCIILITWLIFHSYTMFYFTEAGPPDVYLMGYVFNFDTVVVSLFYKNLTHSGYFTKA